MNEECIFCDGPTEDGDLYCQKEQCQMVKEFRDRENEFERRDMDYPFGQYTRPIEDEPVDHYTREEETE